MADDLLDASLTAREWSVVLAALNFAIREAPLIAPEIRPVRTILCTQLGVDATPGPDFPA